MKDHLYVKLLLYAYPRLAVLEEAARSSAEIKAALSFRAQCDAFTAAVRVADEILIAERLRALKEALDGVVEECSGEERFLLEYKYFRRKAELAAAFAEMQPVCYSRRTYFRLQENLLSKIAAMLLRRGYDREQVAAQFGEYPPFRRVYRALKEGRECAVLRKRKRQELRFPDQNSSETACGRFPRMTSAPMASTARQAAQMAMICTADGAEDGSSDGGGSSASPEVWVR